MPKLPGVNQQRAVKAFQKAVFWIVREGKHITMTNGEHIITIPRANIDDKENIKYRQLTKHFTWPPIRRAS